MYIIYGRSDRVMLFVQLLLFVSTIAASSSSSSEVANESSSSGLLIPKAKLTLTAPILRGQGYIGLVHPTDPGLPSNAPVSVRGSCEYGYRLQCTNAEKCNIDDYKTAWQGPNRYLGLGTTDGAAYTEYCRLYGVTSADCVRVTTPLSLSSAETSVPYIATTTSFSLSNPTNIGFAPILVTGVGWGNGNALNGRTHFLEVYESCQTSYVFPTFTTSTTTTLHTTQTTSTSVYVTPSASASAPSASATQTAQSGGKGLTTGDQAGIAIGVIAVAGILAGILVWRYRRHRQKRRAEARY